MYVFACVVRDFFMTSSYEPMINTMQIFSPTYQKALKLGQYLDIVCMKSLGEDYVPQNPSNFIIRKNVNVNGMLFECPKHHRYPPEGEYRYYMRLIYTFLSTIF